MNRNAKYAINRNPTINAKSLPNSSHMFRSPIERSASTASPVSKQKLSAAHVKFKPVNSLIMTAEYVYCMKEKISIHL